MKGIMLIDELNNLRTEIQRVEKSGVMQATVQQDKFTQLLTSVSGLLNDHPGQTKDAELFDIWIFLERIVLRFQIMLASSEDDAPTPTNRKTASNGSFWARTDDVDRKISNLDIAKRLAIYHVMYSQLAKHLETHKEVMAEKLEELRPVHTANRRWN